MARLMSVALTEKAVVDRSKTVTRRLGWWEDKNGRRILKPGDRLTLCRKVMGRKHDEPLVRFCDVEVVKVTRERLDAITAEDVAREGFPELTPVLFVDFFTGEMLCDRDIVVTRIEWRYLDGEEGPASRGACSHCGREMTLTTAGLLRSHSDLAAPTNGLPWHPHCPGSGEPPKS